MSLHRKNKKEEEIKRRGTADSSTPSAKIWSLKDLDDYIENGHAGTAVSQSSLQQGQGNTAVSPVQQGQNNLPVDQVSAGQKQKQVSEQDSKSGIWSLEDLDKYIEDGHKGATESKSDNSVAQEEIFSLADLDEYIKNGHQETKSSQKTGNNGEDTVGGNIRDTNPTGIMNSVNRVLGNLAGEDNPSLQAQAAEDAIKRIQQEKRKQAWQDMSMSADDKIADVEKQLEDLYNTKKIKQKGIEETGVAGDFADYAELARMTEELAGKSEEEKKAYLEENSRSADDAVKRGKQREELRDIESQIGELKNKRAGYQREKKYQEYAASEDFEKKSAYKEDKEASAIEKVFGLDKGQSDTYRILNILDKYRDKKQEDMTEDEKSEYDWAIMQVAGDPRENDIGHYISSMFHTDTDQGNTAVQEMSHDEVKLYNYIYNTKGEEEAEAYLKDIAEGLNYKAAQKDAEHFKGNTFMEVLGGVETGLDQFRQGGRAIVNGIKSDTPLPTSKEQYEGAMYREDLKGKGPEVFGNSLGQMAYDVVNTSANMIPSIVASAAVGTLAPTAGGIVGAGLLGASAGGNTFNEEWKNGVAKSQAAAYGITSGLSEATMQYALGGISKLGGKERGSIVLGGLDNLSKGRLTAVTSKIDDAIGKALKSDTVKAVYGGAKELGTKMFQEGREEYLQDALDPLFRNITMEEDNDCLKGFVSSESLYSGLLGAISGGMFAGGEVVSHQIEEKVYRNIGENAEEGHMEDILSYAENQEEDLKDFTDSYRVDATEVNAGKMVVAAEKHIGESIINAGTAEEARAAYQDMVSQYEGNAFVEKTAGEALEQVMQEFDIDSRTAENHQGMDNGAEMQMNDASVSEDAGLMEEIQEQENPIGEMPVENMAGIMEDTGSGLAGEAVRISEEDIARKLAQEAAVMPESQMAEIRGDMLRTRKHGTGMTSEYMSEANARKINAMAEGMETDTAKVFRQNWKGSVTPEVYQEVFETVKNAAINEVPIENIAETTKRPDIFNIRAQRIGQEAIQYMYFAGENELAKITENTMSAREVEAVDAIAKAFGKKVHIMDSISNGRSGANGMYQNGEIYLSRKSTNRGRTVLAHETTHMMKESAAEHYQNFEDYIINNLKEQGEYDSVVEQYKGKVGSGDIAVIHEEIAADTTETFFDNPDKFMDFAKSNTSVAQKLVDIVSDLIEKIKSAIQEYAPGSRVAKILQEEVDTYTEARDIWYEGIQELMRQNVEKEDIKKTEDWHKRTKVNSAKKSLTDSSDIRFSLKEIPDTIQKDAMANRKEVAEMDAVATIPDTLFAKGEKRLSEQVEAFFAEKGNNAYNDVIGDVELSRKGIRDDIAHGVGRIKAITFGAVPEVIEKGKVIDYQKNWKGRSYDTVVIAAPINITDKKGNVEEYLTAVIAQRNDNNKNQRFYVHEALSIKKEELLFKTAVPNTGEVRSNNSSNSEELLFKTVGPENGIVHGNNSSDIFSLLQKTLNYKWENMKFSMKDMDGSSLFSSKEDDFAWMEEIMNEESGLAETASILQEGVEAMRKSGKEIDEATVRKISRDILKETGSVYDADTLADNLEKVFSYMESTDHVSYEDMVRVMTEVALPVVDEIGSTDPEMQRRYEEMIEYLRKMPISLSESQREEAAAVADNVRNFMSRNADIMKFRKDGVTLDRGAWSELVKESGNILPPDANEAEMPIVLSEFVRGMKPPVEYYGVDGAARENLAYDVALNIFKKYFGEYAANHKVQKALDGKIDSYKKKVKKELEAAIQKERVETEQKLLAERDYLKEQAQALVHELQQSRREKDAGREMEIQEELDRVNGQIKELKAAHREEIARIKAKNHATWLQRGYRKQETELRNKIRKVWSDLQKKTASPTETSYVPEGMIKAVMDVCTSVDVAGGNKVMANKLSKLRDIYETIKPDSEKMGKYDDMFDHNLYAQIKELQNEFQNRTLKELSYSELKKVYETMNAVKEQIINATKLIGKNKSKEAYQRAQKEIAIIRDVNRDKKSEKALDGLLQTMTKQGLSPMKFKTEMKRLTGYRDGSIMVELADDFNQGSIKKKQIEMEVEKMFDSVLSNEKEINRTIGKKESDWIQLAGYVDKFGDPVMIPRSMMLSLAMHMENKGNTKHVIWGGIRIPDAKLYRKGKMAEAYDRGTVLRLVDVAAFGDSNVDRAGIERECRKKILKFCNDNMTENEKKLLSVSKKFFHEYSGKKINDTSLDLKGYKIARVKNYFPISTDKNFIKSEVSGLIANGTIEGMGILKERVSARNPVNLESIFDVIERHTENVGSYAGYAIPVRNFNKIYNTSMIGYEDSVSNALASVWGEEGKTYIKNFLTDVQGGRFNGQSNFFMKLRGHYAQAVLTGNPSVMIKQAASLPTAAATLGWRPILKALPHFGINLISEFTSKKKIKTDFEKIGKYTPLFWDRTNAAFDSELMDIKKSRTKIKIPVLKQFAEGFLKGIEKVDEATVGSLWYAAESKVKKENKSLKAGSDMYYEKVAELFNEAVLNTQPMYDVTQQADISRNPNALVKALFMFKTQPMQNFNILYDATAEFCTKRRLYKEGKCTKESLKDARNRFVLGVTSQLASAVTFASMTLAAKRLLNREDDDEDILMDMINNTFSSIAGSFVFGSELYEAVSKIVTGDTYFGVEVSVVSSISDMAEKLVSLRNAIDEYGETGTEEEEHAAMRKILQNFNSAVDISAQMFGIPLGNVKKLSDAVTSRLADWRIEDIYKTDEAKKVAKEAYEDGGVTREKLYDALDNGERTEKQIDGKIREALKENDGRIEDAARLHHGGDFKEYRKKVEEIKADGFRQNEVLQAIESKEKELFPEKKGESPETSKGIYGTDDLAYALQNGGDVQEIIDEIIETGKENGKDRSTGIKQAFRDVYKDAYADGDEAERLNIREAISRYTINDRGIFDDKDFYRWRLKYSGKDICKTLEDGNLDDAQAMIDEMYQVKWEHNMESAASTEEKLKAKNKSSSSMKSSISSVYKKLYQEGDASEKQRIISLLNMLRVDGKKIFGQEDYLRWNKEKYD